MTRTVFASCAALLVTQSLLTEGHAWATSPDGTFRVNVEAVALNVSVTTQDGTLLDHLSQDDFAVFDNGRPQAVTVFGRGDIPIDLMLLLDVSSSLYDRFDLVRSAAKGFLTTLRAGDRGAVVGFNERVTGMARWTSDRQALDRVLDEADAGGGTALYTALYVSLREMDKEDGVRLARRRIVVVLSDGEDTRSLVPFEDVLDLCRRGSVSIYTIRIERPPDSLLARVLGLGQRRPSGAYVLGTLAKETGALGFSVTQVDQLPEVYRQIARELAAQYLIGYEPSTRDDERAFHSVAVLVPKHPGALARTRLGYLFATKRHIGFRPILSPRD